MSTGKIKVGIVGAGIGSFHASAYCKLPEVEVVAIADINRGRAEKLARDFKVPKIYIDYGQMITQEELDAISVCTPNYLHTLVAVEALNHGKHVLCEKPLSTNAEEGAKIVEAARKAGKILMMGFNQRFQGESQVLKQFVREGLLGEIYYAKAGWIRRRGIPGIGSWFTEKEKAGGGALIDIGVHVLDLTRWLMGNPRPVKVLASTYAKFGPRGKGKGEWGISVPGGKFDVEDLAIGLIKFENGSTLFLETSWASHVEKEMVFSSLLGTEGGANLFPLHIYTEIHGEAVDITPLVCPVNSYEAEIAHFIRCIRNNQSSISPGEDGLAVMKIIDAIYKSAVEGKEIEID